jgi:hypothetical protein
MQDIRHLLQRYTNIGASEKRKKDAIKTILKDMFSVSINDSAIRIQGSRVYVEVPSSVRYMIHEKKKEVISAVEFILGKGEIRDIC